MPFVLRGTVNVDGVPEAGWTVRACRHSDGAFVGEDVTGSTGEFAFEFVDNVAHDLYAFNDSEPTLGDGGAPYARNLHIGVMPEFEFLAPNAHRYWRVTNFVDSGSSDGVQFSEIRPHLGGIDITDNATRTGTTPTGGGPISVATDNNVSSEIYWNATATGAGAFIEFDFGMGETAIDAFQMGAAGNFPTYWPSQFDLEYSDDGSSWTHYATVMTAAFPGPNSFTTVFSI